MLSRDKSSGGNNAARRAAIDAILLGAALMLSYLESFIPVPLPFPGMKLGLANTAVILCAYLVSLPDAAGVSLCRIIISALLFGSLPSLWFSLSGGAAALMILAAFVLTPARKNVSPAGISAACAAAHNVGQITAACAVFGNLSVFRYLPVLLVSGALFGAITGIIADRIIRSAEKAKKSIWK